MPSLWPDCLKRQPMWKNYCERQYVSAIKMYKIILLIGNQWVCQQCFSVKYSTMCLLWVSSFGKQLRKDNYECQHRIKCFFNVYLNCSCSDSNVFFLLLLKKIIHISMSQIRKSYVPMYSICNSIDFLVISKW